VPLRLAAREQVLQVLLKGLGSIGAPGHGPRLRILQGKDPTSRQLGMCAVRVVFKKLMVGSYGALPVRLCPFRLLGAARNENAGRKKERCSQCFHRILLIQIAGLGDRAGAARDRTAYPTRYATVCSETVASGEVLTNILVTQLANSMKNSHQADAA